MKRLASFVSIAIPVAVIACSAAAAAQTTGRQDLTDTSGTPAPTKQILLTPVAAELNKSVNTKSATVGQQVTATTTAEAKLPNGTTLPSGTKLVGQVSQVQASKGQQKSSMLALKFDRAELKHGQTVELRTLIASVSPPNNPAANFENSPGNNGNAGAIPSANPPATPASPEGVPGSGAQTGTMQTMPQVPTSIPQDTGSLNAPSRTNSFSAIPHATQLPGVMLANAPSSDVSGTLTDSNKNISLDSGTKLLLGVVPQ